jgi:hypothetical protein
MNPTITRILHIFADAFVEYAKGSPTPWDDLVAEFIKRAIDQVGIIDEMETQLLAQGIGVVATEPITEAQARQLVYGRKK